MNISEIAEALEAAGCIVKVWKDSRVYVNKTPNGGRGDYGYCVEGDDARDICDNISKRQGEVSAIIREAMAAQ